MFRWFRKKEFANKETYVPPGLEDLPRQVVNYLATRLPNPQRHISGIENLDHFRKLSQKEQHQELVTLYFVLEHFICEEFSSPIAAKRALHAELTTAFPDVRLIRPFNLIFVSREEQEWTLCSKFLLLSCDKAVSFLGAVKGNFLLNLQEGLKVFPNEHESLKPWFNNSAEVESSGGFVYVLEQISQHIYQKLEGILGPATAKGIYEFGYDQLARTYMGFEAFPVILRLMPSKILDQQKINILAGERNRKLLSDKIHALDATNQDLQQTNEELNRYQKALEKAKREAERNAQIKEQFLANMSHEIRTPLNAIIGFNHLLLEGKILPEQQEYLSGINSSSTSLLAIVNDILDLSKFEAGKVPLEQIPFEVKPMVEQAVNTFDLEARDKGIDLSLCMDEAIPQYLVGDPHRLNQILFNLIGNALKFTAAGSVAVSVNHLSAPKPDQSRLQFVVKDSGIGIPQEKIDRIFESFTQVSPTINRKFGGTGLGLTISQKLAEAMGGNIRVTSQLDEGSTFVLELTFRHPDQQWGGPKKAAEVPKMLAPVDILVAEDNTFNQVIIRKLLSKWDGAGEVRIASNGKVALNVLEKDTFDIILMDVQMPEMDGLEATERIRKSADKNLRNIPILGVTAHALKPELDRCREAGMNDCVTKPFNPEDLFEKITSLTAPIRETSGVQ